MLPGLQRWDFVVFGVRLRFYFFARTRREACQRDRHFIITVRSSAGSTPARLIIGSRRLAQR
jgi:hypothetical protein